MTTEPTQTPRTGAALQKGALIQGKPIDIRLCSGVAQDLYDESQSLERELAKANTRIEILSEGKTCDKCVNPLVCNDLGKCGQVQMLQRDLATATQRIAELESRVKQLEQENANLFHAKNFQDLMRSHQTEALSPPPLAVEVDEKL